MCEGEKEEEGKIVEFMNEFPLKLKSQQNPAKNWRDCGKDSGQKIENFFLAPPIWPWMRPEFGRILG